MPLARRVQPGPLRRRPQLLRPLPRHGSRRRRARPGLRPPRRADAHGPAAPARRRPLDAGRSGGRGADHREPEHQHRQGDGSEVRRLVAALPRRRDGRHRPQRRPRPRRRRGARPAGAVMARVLFEPIGEEIDCDEEEAVLDAAFRAGYSFVHGCREGQCSACKAYLLEGEVALKPYSTFALSESEEEQGYTLLCRAMPDSDLVVELLHFDPDDSRAEPPIRDGRATVAALEPLTQDITCLVLDVAEPGDFDYRPGHYVDVWVPDCDERRSF